MTIKATDVTLKGWELIEGVTNAPDDFLLVIVRDVLLGLAGLFDLPHNHPLDGEEDKRIVVEELLELFQVFRTEASLLEVFLHTNAAHQVPEEPLGRDDRECLGCF